MLLSLGIIYIKASLAPYNMYIFLYILHTFNEGLGKKMIKKGKWEE